MARNRPLRGIVDTNVVAYYLLATEPVVDQVRAFWHRPLDVAAPTLWEAEVSNVLGMAVRTGLIDKRVALRRLGMAARLGIRSVPTRRRWRGALARAMNTAVAACDTLFVELAIREHEPLVTFDAKLLAAFPDVAVRPDAVVGPQLSGSRRSEWVSRLERSC
jgi:predicted nucleic acid-binding protein